MRAHIGDRLIIKSHHVGEPTIEAEIIEVKGENGEPPFIVRWLTDGHEAMIFPGSDALIEHHRKTPAKHPEV